MTLAAQVPVFGTLRARDPDEEDRAPAAAAQFISNTDRADYDGIWSRTSALAKALMSRIEFGQRLAMLPQVDSAEPPELYLAFPALGEQRAWFVRESAGGFLVGALATSGRASSQVSGT